MLGLYRIPHGRRTRPPAPSANQAPAPRQPVLLQHGLLDSSATWVVNRPTQSLAFLLADADAGYDVWLSNSRWGEICARTRPLDCKGRWSPSCLNKKKKHMHTHMDMHTVSLSPPSCLALAPNAGLARQLLQGQCFQPKPHWT